MTKITKKDEEDLLESEEEDTESNDISDANKTAKKPENIPNIITAKYTRPPAFQKSVNFGRGSFQNNNFANKQRPGRAAGRGR